MVYGVSKPMEMSNASESAHVLLNVVACLVSFLWVGAYNNPRLPQS
jgi:hypothetical protein